MCVVAVGHPDWSHELEEDERLITAEVCVITCQAQRTSPLFQEFSSAFSGCFSFVVEKKP